MVRPRALVGCYENGSDDLRDWLERDVITKPFDAALQVGDSSGLADLVEIGFSELTIADALGEHVIGGDQDFVSDGEGGAQRAAARDIS